MKHFFIISFLSLVLFSACKKEEELPEEPQLPPSESFLMSFDDFDSTKTKSLKAADTNYWFVSALNVGFWNIAVFVTCAVPVAAFQNSFNHKPIYKGDNTWEWVYTYNGFFQSHAARLVAKPGPSTTSWEMYISRVTPNPYSEVLWYSGTTNNDGTGASWKLNLYNETTKAAEPFLDIVYKKVSEDNKTLRYTNVKLNDTLNNGNFIEYAKQTGNFDARFSIDTKNSNDLDIEWNSVTKEGHVRCINYFGDANWRCWDATLQNTTCN